MNVRELKEAIKDLPDDWIVEIEDSDLGPAYSQIIASVQTGSNSCMLKYANFIKTQEGKLHTILVCYTMKNDHLSSWFQCEAEDKTHAIEQCKNAYPGCKIITTID